MRKILTLALAATAAIYSIGCANTNQTAPAPVQNNEPAPTREMDAETKAWFDMHKPGMEHTSLAKHVGKWDVKMEHFMKPGEPEVAMGSATYDMVLGRRFLRESSVFNSPDGRFVILGYTGYNNVEKCYEAAYFGDMETGMTFCKGSEDPATKRISFSWVWKFPGPDGKLLDVPTRLVTWDENPDCHITEFFMTFPGAPESLSMRNTYTRKK